MGSVFVAFISRNILMKRQIKKPPNHNFESRPEVSFTFPKQAAKATSNRPAIINRSQFMNI